MATATVAALHCCKPQTVVPEGTRALPSRARSARQSKPRDTVGCCRPSELCPRFSPASRGGQLAFVVIGLPSGGLTTMANHMLARLRLQSLLNTPVNLRFVHEVLKFLDASQQGTKPAYPPPLPSYSP